MSYGSRVVGQVFGVLKQGDLVEFIEAPPWDWVKGREHLVLGAVWRIYSHHTGRDRYVNLQVRDLNSPLGEIVRREQSKNGAVNGVFADRLRRSPSVESTDDNVAVV